MDNNITTILYVDDEDMNLFLFDSAFSTKYNVITATSGQKGLDMLYEYKSNIVVVISDMRMPGMNGIEFIAKAKEKFENIAYFILTGFAYDDNIDQALKTGLIYRFFTKPFKINEIEKAIEDAINNLDLNV